MTEVDDLVRTHGPVGALIFDERYEEHQRERASYQKHIVAVSEILEAHANAPRYFLNSKGAPMVMIGITDAGRVRAVPLDPSDTYGVWRPRTAFTANAHHRNRYQGGDE